MNKLAKKWKTTGLLEGLNDIDSNKISMILETAAKFLIKQSRQETTKESEIIAGLMIPAIRRLYDLGIMVSDIKSLYEDLRKLYTNSQISEGQSGISYEAELLSEYCNHFSKIRK